MSSEPIFEQLAAEHLWPTRRHNAPARHRWADEPDTEEIAVTADDSPTGPVPVTPERERS